jgi:hypothetical protein
MKLQVPEQAVVVSVSVGLRMTETFLRGAGLVALILGFLAAPLPAEAQRAAQPLRVGVLLPGAPGPQLNAFRQGLQALGSSPRPSP